MATWQLHKGLTNLLQLKRPRFTADTKTYHFVVYHQHVYYIVTKSNNEAYMIRMIFVHNPPILTGKGLERKHSTQTVCVLFPVPQQLVGYVLLS